MKKFNFSLQKILEIKEQLLDNLKIELSNISAELNILQLNIENLKTKYADMENEYVEKTYNSITANEITYYKMLIENILRQIENKESLKEILLKKKAAKQKEIINMNVEISSLEKLKEKELEKYSKECLKKEEIFIEEFISNKSMTNKFAV